MSREFRRKRSTLDVEVVHGHHADADEPTFTSSSWPKVKPESADHITWTILLSLLFKLTHPHQLFRHNSPLVIHSSIRIIIALPPCKDFHTSNLLKIQFLHPFRIKTSIVYDNHFVTIIGFDALLSFLH